VQGPDLPLAPNGDQLIAGDVPAILEPNGSVLLVAFGTTTQTTFVEYNPDLNQFAIVSGAPTSSDWENTKMLLLPNGHGLVSLSTQEWYEVAFRTADPASVQAWAPAITSFPSTVSAGQTVTLAGNQLCGLSECSSYGDDNQQAENYPMVRFIDSQGEIIYLRSHNVSTRSIAPRQAGTLLLDIPATMANGMYSVEVVAMGIPSYPAATVNVQ